MRIRMTYERPLQSTEQYLLKLSASFEQTGPFPIEGTGAAKREWLLRRERNIKRSIEAATVLIPAYRDDPDADDIYATLCDMKQQGSIALRTLTRLVRARPLKDSKPGLARFESQYGTLKGSVVQLFILEAPDLARIAEKAL